jgi:hypothetical protein
MNVSNRANTLRTSLPVVVELVPVNESEQALVSLADDPLYHAQAVGRSSDGLTAADHDAILFVPGLPHRARKPRRA